MRKSYSTTIELARVRNGRFASNAGRRSGKFFVFFGSTKTMLQIIVGSADDWAESGMLSVTHGPAWDHVSVSTETRTPTWEEMAWVKAQFFEPEECVVQYHPPESKYVNAHPFVLHLWKPCNADFPMPPLECV